MLRWLLVIKVDENVELPCSLKHHVFNVFIEIIKSINSKFNIFNIVFGRISLKFWLKLVYILIN